MTREQADEILRLSNLYADSAYEYAATYHRHGVVDPRPMESAGNKLRDYLAGLVSPHPAAKPQQEKS